MWTPPNARGTVTAGSYWSWVYTLAGVGPACHPACRIEEQESCGRARFGEQGGIGRRYRMGAYHGSEVEVGEDVGVVDQYGLVAEQRDYLGQASAGIEQLGFVAHGNVVEIVSGGQEVVYLVGEVMGVDDNASYACVAHFVDHACEHRSASHLHEGLGMGIGPRFKPAAVSGGEYHAYHDVNGR